MTHTHTQGPWVCATGEDWDGAHITDKHGRIVADCQGCDIPGACGEVGTDEAKANARLIAAAPDLLDALELLMNQYDSSPDFIMGGNLTNEPFLMAHAAIAKATGKEDA